MNKKDNRIIMYIVTGIILLSYILGVSSYGAIPVFGGLMIFCFGFVAGFIYNSKKL